MPEPWAHVWFMRSAARACAASSATVSLADRRPGLEPLRRRLLARAHRGDHPRRGRDAAVDARSPAAHRPGVAGLTSWSSAQQAVLIADVAESCRPHRGEVTPTTPAVPHGPGTPARTCTSRAHTAPTRCPQRAVSGRRQPLTVNGKTAVQKANWMVIMQVGKASCDIS
jgi:hypothetical protein